MVLEVAMLHQDRPKAELDPFGSCESAPAKDGTPQETFWG
jgi:hypothetical protein